METIVRTAWFLLAVIHLAPAMVLFSPSLTERLYGISSSTDVGLLIVHRGALFLAILVAAIWAVFDPASRRIASIIVGISVLSFLLLYFRAGMPAGPIRTIALVDLVGVAPLIVVLIAAWSK